MTEALRGIESVRRPERVVPRPRDPEHPDASPCLPRLLELHDRSFAWSLVVCRGDREEALDVLQSCYVKLLEGRLRFDGRSTFKTWFFAVIRRTAAMRYRKEGLRRLLLLSWRESSRDGKARPDTVERPAVDPEQAQQVREALAGLSPRQRQLLELVFYHDLSIAEAARVMGVSVGTGRTHYERGKKELMRRLVGRGWKAS